MAEARHRDRNRDGDRFRNREGKVAEAVQRQREHPGRMQLPKAYRQLTDSTYSALALQQLLNMRQIRSHLSLTLNWLRMDGVGT